MSDEQRPHQQTLLPLSHHYLTIALNTGTESIPSKGTGAMDRLDKSLEDLMSEERKARPPKKSGGGGGGGGGRDRSRGGGGGGGGTCVSRTWLARPSRAWRRRCAGAQPTSDDDLLD